MALYFSDHLDSKEFLSGLQKHVEQLKVPLHHIREHKQRTLSHLSGMMRASVSRILDLRRDVSSLKTMMIYLTTKPKKMRPGFLSSLNAAYTASEITELLRHSALHEAVVTNDFFGLCICGQKR